MSDVNELNKELQGSVISEVVGDRDDLVFSYTKPSEVQTEPPTYHHFAIREVDIENDIEILD